jgi:hypothetical protein
VFRSCSGWSTCLDETRFAKGDASRIIVHRETDTLSGKGERFVVKLGVVEVPGACTGNSELIFRVQFGEPAVYAYTVLLKPIL